MESQRGSGGTAYTHTHTCLNVTVRREDARLSPPPPRVLGAHIVHGPTRDQHGARKVVRIKCRLRRDAHRACTTKGIVVRAARTSHRVKAEGTEKGGRRSQPRSFMTDLGFVSRCVPPPVVTADHCLGGCMVMIGVFFRLVIGHPAVRVTRATQRAAVVEDNTVTCGKLCAVKAVG